MVFSDTGPKYFWSCPSAYLSGQMTTGCGMNRRWRVDMVTSLAVQLERSSLGKRRRTRDEPDICWERPMCFDDDVKRETRRLIDERTQTLVRTTPIEHCDESLSTMHLDFCVCVAPEQLIGQRSSSLSCRRSQTRSMPHQRLLVPFTSSTFLVTVPYS